jgi:hypothetical protein
MENDSDDVCAICTVDTGSLITTDCGHKYHLNCILSWNSRQSDRKEDTTCPTCRTVMHQCTKTDPKPPQDFQLIVIDMELAFPNEDETPEAKMLRIIADNEEAELQHWIEEDAAIVNMRMPSEMTPLLHSLHRRCFNLVHCLVRHGANVNSHDSSGITPLMVAIAMDSENCSRYLLNHGAEVNAKNAKGDSALHIAIRGHNTKLVQMLLHKGAVVNDLNHANRSIYHTLAKTLTTMKMNTLLKDQNPTCLSARDYTGSTVMHLAVEHKNKRFIRCFFPVISHLLTEEDYSGREPEDLDEYEEHISDMIEELITT